jgi:hypothetical protein
MQTANSVAHVTQISAPFGMNNKNDSGFKNQNSPNQASMPDSEYSVKIYAGGQYILSEEHGHFSGSASVAGNTNKADGNEAIINQNPTAVYEEDLKISTN